MYQTGSWPGRLFVVLAEVNSICSLYILHACKQRCMAKSTILIAVQQSKFQQNTSHDDLVRDILHDS
jgi:hypothetical protein